MASGERRGRGGNESPRDSSAPVKASAPSRAQSSEQERAKRAWEWVKEAKLCSKPERYGTLAKKLPNYLMTSGFEQTMAYLFSKSDRSDRKPEGLLFAQMVRRSLGALRSAGVPFLQDNATLSQMMDAVVKLSMDDSRRAAHEAMRMAEWLRRFAPTELGEEK